MAKQIIAGMLAAAILSGCAATGNLCSVGPFQPSPGFEHRLTTAEKVQADLWNSSGEDICGWKPAK